jgi:hypothetical protein
MTDIGIASKSESIQRSMVGNSRKVNVGAE